MEKKTDSLRRAVCLRGRGRDGCRADDGHRLLGQLSGRRWPSARRATRWGRKKYPDRVIEVETAPKSGNAEVDALIREARGQLDQIADANDAIADPALSRQIEDIEATCRLILQRLEEQPNMLSQLRTFLRYYLPATLKLLNARAALEAEVSAGQQRGHRRAHRQGRRAGAVRVSQAA